MTSELIDEAVKSLSKETGFRITWEQPGRQKDADGRLTVHYNHHNFTYYVHSQNEVRQYHARKILHLAANYNPLLVIAERILPPVKKIFQENGIDYLEINGNVHLQNTSFFIHIDTHVPVRIDRPVTNRAFTKTGLKAVFHFLNNKGSINDNFRKIAAETGIALGNIKYIIDGLTEAGYVLKVNKKDIKLKNPKALLERWVAGYRETLKPTLLKGTFHFSDKQLSQNWQMLNLEPLDAVWSGEPAGDLLTDYLGANFLQLYTSSPASHIMQQWKLIPEKNGELEVYKQFWEKTTDVYTSTAPPLIVYTDLLITEDPRCLEAAELIYKKYLKDAFEND